MKNIKDLFSYLESFSNLEKTFNFSERNYRLDRMHILCDLFHNPHYAFKTIHVAGTKGKGSTSAFIASALVAHGYRTGLYTSPHVSSYCERITVNRKFPEPGMLLNLGISIKKRISELKNFFPTTFELLTLLAFCYFRETACDYVVAEVGIGGRLDATNVVLPLVSVITPIDIEHTDVLGNTIEEIAFEKAGIIKQGIPVFSGFQQKQVKQVLAGVCEKRNTHITFLDEILDEISIEIIPWFTYCDIKVKGKDKMTFSLSMLGEFQAENAGLALITLNSFLPGLSFKKVKTGFESTKLPGRFEIIRKEPLIILDGAHTPLAVTRVLFSFKKLLSIMKLSSIKKSSFVKNFLPEKGILLFGSVMGKNHEKMAEILAPEFDSVIISTPGYFKESDPDAVYESFKTKNVKTSLEKNPQKAFEKALNLSESRLPILVTGSFYMLAEIRKLII